MEEALTRFFDGVPGWMLAVIILVSLLFLAKGADLLVDEAVALSLKWHIPKAVIGATIVSLGTTTPEAAVSVYAAIQGSPGLALGNAVGSILCDTGLILGLAIIMRPIPLERKIVNRQGWLQFASGVLLIAFCIPYGNLGDVFLKGGLLSQGTGFLFLALLVAYIGASIYWSMGSRVEIEEKKEVESPALWIFSKFLFAIAVVILSSHFLIPAVQETAVRLHVPEAVIAATLVAFGTSLPEFVTVMTAAWKGHGQLGVGNVIGADILNVLFVAGAAAAVTPQGLHAPPEFFRLLFPALFLMLLVFRVGIFMSPDKMKRPFGFVLLGLYIVTTFLVYRV